MTHQYIYTQYIYTYIYRSTFVNLRVCDTSNTQNIHTYINVYIQTNIYSSFFINMSPNAHFLGGSMEWSPVTPPSPPSHPPPPPPHPTTTAPNTTATSRLSISSSSSPSSPLSPPSLPPRRDPLSTDPPSPPPEPKTRPRTDPGPPSHTKCRVSTSSHAAPAPTQPPPPRFPLLPPWRLGDPLPSCPEQPATLPLHQALHDHPFSFGPARSQGRGGGSPDSVVRFLGRLPHPHGQARAPICRSACFADGSMFGCVYVHGGTDIVYIINICVHRTDYHTDIMYKYM